MGPLVGLFGATLVHSGAMGPFSGHIIVKVDSTRWLVPRRAREEADLSIYVDMHINRCRARHIQRLTRINTRTQKRMQTLKGSKTERKGEGDKRRERVRERVWQRQRGRGREKETAILKPTETIRVFRHGRRHRRSRRLG